MKSVFIIIFLATAIFVASSRDLNENTEISNNSVGPNSQAKSELTRVKRAGGGSWFAGAGGRRRG